MTTRPISFRCGRFSKTSARPRGSPLRRGSHRAGASRRVRRRPARRADAGHRAASRRPRLIRGDDRSRHTPIIFLTANDIDRPQMEEAYALGCGGLPGEAAVCRSSFKPRCGASFELFQDKQRAKHEADQLRLLVHGTTDYAIFMLDPQGHVVTWNAGAERFKGYKADEIIGQHFSSSTRKRPSTGAGPPTNSRSPQPKVGSRTRAGGSARTARSFGPTSSSRRCKDEAGNCGASRRSPGT